MAVTPEQILELAVTLADGNSECSRRAAVSRAYYASWLAARETSEMDHVDKWLQDANAIAGGPHEKVIQRFAFRQAREVVRVPGYGLRLLKQEREIADYEIRKTVGERTARDAIESARRLVAQFRHIDQLARKT